MTNFRQIHVKFWKDAYVLDLTPNQKLIFIYLFSNELTSLSGIYQLPMKVIRFETGLSAKVIYNSLQKFQDDGKIEYADGIIWVKKLRKYHETRSPKIQTRIKNDVDDIPDIPLKERYITYYELKMTYSYSIDRSPPKEVEVEVNKDKEEDKIITEDIFDKWQELFPDKPQPRRTGTKLVIKIRKRLGTKDFYNRWDAAMTKASESPTLQKESWFTLEYFARNDENYQKCLDGWMEWKDDQNAQKKGKGRTTGALERAKQEQKNG